MCRLLVGVAVGRVGFGTDASEARGRQSNHRLGRPFSEESELGYSATVRESVSLPPGTRQYRCFQ